MAGQVGYGTFGVVSDGDGYYAGHTDRIGRPFSVIGPFPTARVAGEVIAAHAAYDAAPGDGDAANRLAALYDANPQAVTRSDADHDTAWLDARTWTATV